MRLVADAMLGRLAKWLRVLGYDTLYWRGDDIELLRLVLEENRPLLCATPASRHVCHHLNVSSCGKGRTSTE